MENNVNKDSVREVAQQRLAGFLGKLDKQYDPNLYVNRQGYGARGGFVEQSGGKAGRIGARVGLRVKGKGAFKRMSH